MKLLTELKKTLSAHPGIAAAILAGSVFLAAPASATPPAGLATEFIVGTSTAGILYEEIDLYLKRNKDQTNGIPEWKLKLDTKGLSELYVVRNSFAPNATT